MFTLFPYTLFENYKYQKFSKIRAKVNQVYALIINFIIVFSQQKCLIS